MVILYQWPCNRNRWKLEVPIPYIRPMFQGYVREYTPKIWPYMVQYLHFRILEFPLICWFITPTRWCPRSESLSWGPHNSSFTLVYRWYIELINGVYKPINITRGAPPCIPYNTGLRHPPLVHFPLMVPGVPRGVGETVRQTQSASLSSFVLRVWPVLFWVYYNTYL